MLLLAKIIISSAVVSEELGLHGLPGAFLMTVPQLQLIAAYMGVAWQNGRMSGEANAKASVLRWGRV